MRNYIFGGIVGIFVGAIIMFAFLQLNGNINFESTRDDAPQTEDQGNDQDDTVEQEVDITEDWTLCESERVNFSFYYPEELLGEVVQKGFEPEQSVDPQNGAALNNEECAYETYTFSRDGNLTINVFYYANSQCDEQKSLLGEELGILTSSDGNNFNQLELVDGDYSIESLAKHSPLANPEEETAKIAFHVSNGASLDESELETYFEIVQSSSFDGHYFIKDYASQAADEDFKTYSTSFMDISFDYPLAWGEPITPQDFTGGGIRSELPVLVDGFAQSIAAAPWCASTVIGFENTEAVFRVFYQPTPECGGIRPDRELIKSFEGNRGEQVHIYNDQFERKTEASVKTEHDRPYPPVLTLELPYPEDGVFRPITEEDLLLLEEVFKTLTYDATGF